MSEWRALNVRGCGSGSKPKICESEFKVALFLIGEIKSTIHTREQVCSTMYSLCVLKKPLQPEAIPHVLSKLYN